MKRLWLATLCVIFWPLAAHGQFAIMGETEMTWPGIRYQVYSIAHLSDDRLLVGIRLHATDQAPVGGTLIGYPVPIPPHANKYDVAAGYYHPRPFSLASSVMVVDATQERYPALAANSPPGVAYFPTQILGSLRPGQSIILSVQFAVPPPPPPPPGRGAPPKQTVSFLFPEAKEPIKKMPIPPLVPASG